MAVSLMQFIAVIQTGKPEEMFPAMNDFFSQVNTLDKIGVLSAWQALKLYQASIGEVDQVVNKQFEIFKEALLGRMLSVAYEAKKINSLEGDSILKEFSNIVGTVDSKYFPSYL